MTTELSSLIFTNKADIVPSSGTEEIINTGIANTLKGADRITGTGVNTGIHNWRTIDTGSGNDTIEASARDTGILNQNGGLSIAVIDTGVGHDSIIATGGRGIYNQGIISTGSGNDVITATGGEAIFNSSSTISPAIIDTGDGNDTITGDQGIRNEGGTIRAGSGDDVITSTGDGSIYNINRFDVIDTGDGTDIITGSSIYNQGTISTGSGNDSIIGTSSIYNDGTIDTGAGKDIVDARNGGFIGSGKTFLGADDDIVKGFGSENFYGGRGKDTLELTSGDYTVGVSGGTLGPTVSFTSNGLTMYTSGFEELIAGSTTYNFTSLSNGQTFTVA